MTTPELIPDTAVTIYVESQYTNNEKTTEKRDVIISHVAKCKPIFTDRNGSRYLVIDWPICHDLGDDKNLLSLTPAKRMKRWGYDRSVYYRWQNSERRKPLLELLNRGCMLNDRTDTVAPSELERLCNERGFTISQLATASNLQKNPIKAWMSDETRCTRFWDLLEGMADAVSR